MQALAFVLLVLGARADPNCVDKCSSSKKYSKEGMAKSQTCYRDVYCAHIEKTDECLCYLFEDEEGNLAKTKCLVKMKLARLNKKFVDFDKIEKYCSATIGKTGDCKTPADWESWAEFASTSLFDTEKGQFITDERQYKKVAELTFDYMNTKNGGEHEKNRADKCSFTRETFEQINLENNQKKFLNDQALEQAKAISMENGLTYDQVRTMQKEVVTGTNEGAGEPWKNVKRVV